MLCCIGLFGGYAVGQYLGGPWTVVAPVAGFGIGLAADMRLMKAHERKPRRHALAEGDGHEMPLVRTMEADGSGAACHGGTSGTERNPDSPIAMQDRKAA